MKRVWTNQPRQRSRERSLIAILKIPAAACSSGWKTGVPSYPGPTTPGPPVPTKHADCIRSGGNVGAKSSLVWFQFFPLFRRRRRFLLLSIAMGTVFPTVSLWARNRNFTIKVRKTITIVYHTIRTGYLFISSIQFWEIFHMKFNSKQSNLWYFYWICFHGIFH